jgi:CheY-like chemotaxis protein
MTARVQRHEIEQYLAMGAADVISKPFDPMTLSAQVADIWVKAHETRS